MSPGARRLAFIACWAAASLAGCEVLSERFVIGIERQGSACLPLRAALIDKGGRRLVRGGLAAFRARGLQPFLRDGALVVKRVAGLPGDAVEVTGCEDAATAEVRVNGVAVARGLPLAALLPAGRRMAYCGRWRLAGAYWLMGDSSSAWDSRYWGPVAEGRIVGRAYALW
ncbi:MAG: S26 family signal peptidase [Duodenibacillus sp.]|nr:S26 family signal peptidase [Duodenibacillus sp.]